MAEQHPVDHPAPSLSGWGLVVLGAVPAGIGLLILAADATDGPPEWVGQLLLLVGGVLVGIGAIAAGVELGLDRHESKRQRAG